MNPHATQTAALARFIVTSRFDTMPPKVRHAGKRALLNFLGTALGGAHDPAIDTAAAVLGPLSGPAAARVIGRNERFDMLTAAFLNAASGNVLDFDDTHHPTVIHPTSPIAPALLALAETHRMSGADLLHALVLGMEVACRLGNAVTTSHYIRGWHITSTCGAVGAAAASCRALALTEEQTVWALGLGANQACGLVECLGSMAKSVSVGNAARSGVVSALLARAGLTAAPQTLEGPRGFVPVMSDAPDPTRLTTDLGEHWEVMNNALKPYPSGVVLHPVVDACLELRAQQRIAPESIARVRVRGNPLLAQRADRPQPASGREAAVSAQHTVAVCFLFGAAGVAEYRDALTADPIVRDLGGRVSVDADPSIAVEGAQVTVELTSGSTHTATIAHALGSLAAPMSDTQLEAKVRGLAVQHGGDVPVARLIDTAWRLDLLADAASLLDLAA